MTEPDCIFCRIVAGEAPAHRIHETDHCLAFLDAAPAGPGHTLVVPKAHHETLVDARPETVATVFSVAREVAAAVEATVSPDGLNIVQSNGAAAGQEIAHLHVHVVPRWTDDDTHLSWPHDSEATSEVAAELRKQF